MQTGNQTCLPHCVELAIGGMEQILDCLPVQPLVNLFLKPSGSVARHARLAHGSSCARIMAGVVEMELDLDSVHIPELSHKELGFAANLDARLAFARAFFRPDNPSVASMVALPCLGPFPLGLR
jgi:hypothetical protein